jgi:O-antigen/teichoic acid export membrane protein
MAAGLILFLPEAASTVLVPRVSAAAHGARDLERTRAEVRQTHRALAVLLPPMVALGMVWAGPITGRLLPAFRAGVPALRFLALGALLLATATLPGYFVMASGRAPRLFAVASVAALLTAALVFTVAAHDHRPASIALAAACGYGIFALGLVALAAPGLCANAAECLGFAVLSFVPALWGTGLTLAACSLGGGETVGVALVRSLAILAVYLPVLWWFGRGAGLRRLAHEWLSGRVAPA